MAAPPAQLAESASVGAPASAATLGPAVNAGPATVPVDDGQQGPIRQTEEEATAEAVRTRKPVEVAAFRGESREVFINPDGTATALEHVQPVWVVRDGRWVRVDPTLMQAADGSIGPKAAPLSIQLSPGDDARAPTEGDRPLVTVERAGRTMSLDWPGRLPAPRLEGDRATYAEVYSGVDLVVNVTATGFSHVLVIKNAQAALNPELTELDFGLTAKGLTVRAAADGGLTAVDSATGGAVLESATPMMWDSGAPAAAPAARAQAKLVDPRPDAAVESLPDTAKRAEVDVVLGNNSLKLVPDRAMLTDPTTRWPVYVDPIWQDTRNSGWAMVASGFKDQEYWKFGKDEGVGECPVSSGWCNGTGVKRLFYALPTPYQGKTILNAEFRVTMTHTFDSSAKNVSLYRASKGIGPGTNWNNMPQMSVHQQTKAPTGKQGSCTATNQNVAFDATPAVRESVTHGWGTTTFGLQAQNEADHTAWKRFCGNAVLSVRYNRAPARPAQADLTMSPGGRCVSGDARPYVDRPPTLHMILKDPDHSAAAAENIHGDVQVIWKNPDGTNTVRAIGTDWKASGSRFSVSLPADTPQNTVISWSVRAGDEKVWGPWSWADDQTVCEFVYDQTKPPAPDIDSAEYLPNDAAETTSACVENATALGAVGRYGTFTFDSASTDQRKSPLSSRVIDVG